MAPTQNARSLTDSQHARVFHPTPDPRFQDVDMNVSLTVNADLKNTATTGSAPDLAHSAGKARPARMLLTIDQYVNVQKATSDRH